MASMNYFLIKQILYFIPYLPNTGLYGISTVLFLNIFTYKHIKTYPVMYKKRFWNNLHHVRSNSKDSKAK